MFKGFRDFILRGNVMDLAVAVIIGAAFTAIVTALTANIINPLLGAFIGKPNFDYLVAHINGGEIRYGTFLTAIVNFLLIASRRLLLPCTAHSIPPEEVPPARPGSGHQSLPTVPQRHPRRRDPLQVLHPARIARNSKTQRTSGGASGLPGLWPCLGSISAILSSIASNRLRSFSCLTPRSFSR